MNDGVPLSRGCHLWRDAGWSSCWELGLPSQHEEEPSPIWEIITARHQGGLWKAAETHLRGSLAAEGADIRIQWKERARFTCSTVCSRTCPKSI